MTTFPTKAELRGRILAGRSQRSAAARTAAHSRIAAHLAPLLAAMAQQQRPAHVRAATTFTVCSFYPLPSEPLPPGLTAELAAAGMRVLLPLTERGGPLDWCVVNATDLPGDFDGDDPSPFARGALGILEPTGPRLGPLAIRSADVVLVPALAVDTAGTRLGRGAGHYDRSLALLDAAPGRHAPGDTEIRAQAAGYVTAASEPQPHPRLIAVLFDDEFVDALPREPHDVPVTDVVTPELGLRRIAPDARHVAQDGPRGASSL